MKLDLIVAYFHYPVLRVKNSFKKKSWGRGKNCRVMKQMIN